MATQESNVDDRLVRLTQDFLKKKAAFYYQPVSAQQAATAIDFPAKGPMWASRTVLPAPREDAILGVVLDCIKELGNGHEDFTPPSTADVKVQWSGFRKGVEQKEPEPDISEREKFEKLMRDTSSPTTILYAHGGFY